MTADSSKSAALPERYNAQRASASRVQIRATSRGRLPLGHDVLGRFLEPARSKVQAARKVTST